MVLTARVQGKTVRVGDGRADVPADVGVGKYMGVSVKLTKAGRRLLKQRGTLKVQIRAALDGRSLRVASGKLKRF